MSSSLWNPRGEARFPDIYKKAVPGKTRVRNVHTGWTGTITRIGKEPKHQTVSVRWDRSGAVGQVVAAAFDLEEIKEGEDDPHWDTKDETGPKINPAEWDRQRQAREDVRQKLRQRDPQWSAKQSNKRRVG